MEQITEHISSSNLRIYSKSLESFSQLEGEGVTHHVVRCKRQRTVLFSGRKPNFWYLGAAGTGTTAIGVGG